MESLGAMSFEEETQSGKYVHLFYSIYSIYINNNERLKLEFFYIFACSKTNIIFLIEQDCKLKFESRRSGSGKICKGC